MKMYFSIEFFMTGSASCGMRITMSGLGQNRNVIFIKLDNFFNFMKIFYLTYDIITVFN